MSDSGSEGLGFESQRDHIQTKKASNENLFSVGAFFVCMSELPVAGLEKTTSIPTGLFTQ